MIGGYFCSRSIENETLIFNTIPSDMFNYVSLNPSLNIYGSLDRMEKPQSGYIICANTRY
jgi:hypothetical protein